MNLKEITKDLLERVAEGDERSFAKLFDIHSSQAFRFAYYFLRSKALCDEVVSDVFIRIWNNRKKMAEITNFEAYIFTLTKNQSLTYLDKISKTPAFTNDISRDLISDIENPEEQILANELEKAINEAIDNLPEKCKIIFLMSRENKLRHHQIAEILEISEKTVNAQISIALKKLYSELQKYLYSLLIL